MLDFPPKTKNLFWRQRFEKERIEKDKKELAKCPALEAIISKMKPGEAEEFAEVIWSKR